MMPTVLRLSNRKKRLEIRGKKCGLCMGDYGTTCSIIMVGLGCIDRYLFHLFPCCEIAPQKNFITGRFRHAENSIHWLNFHAELLIMPEVQRCINVADFCKLSDVFVIWIIIGKLSFWQLGNITANVHVWKASVSQLESCIISFCDICEFIDLSSWSIQHLSLLYFFVVHIYGLD